MSELEKLLNQIEKVASWKQHKSNIEKLDVMVAKCLSRYPDQGAVIQARIEIGKENGRYLEPFFKIGMDHGTKSSKAEQQIEYLKRHRPDLVAVANNDLGKGDKKKLDFLLGEIEKFASWDSPPSGQPAEAIDICLLRFPQCETAVEERKQRGEEAIRLLKPFHKIGTKYGLKSVQAEQALAELRELRTDLVDKATKSITQGEAARRRNDEARKLKRKGRPLSTVQSKQVSVDPGLAPSVSPHVQEIPNASDTNLHPSDIRGLEPSSHWRLTVDETGSAFGDSARNMEQSNSKLGRFAGLLLPDQHGLQSLKSGWHAVDCRELREIDEVVQAIVDAPVGVIGINVQQLPDAATERWAFGVLRLIDLVLRLLPLAGSTTLTVEIENRGEFTRNMEWPAVAKDAMLRLAQSYPERAKLIACTIQVIGKNDSPYNGYIDALAYIWAGTTPHSRACLQQAGFEGTCYLPGNAETISRAWEWLDRGVTLDGTDWATLLTQPGAETSSSITGTILERLGQASHEDTELWQRYLAHTLDHIESKAVDLKMLGQQVEWLERWSPPGQFLPRPARLLWLTAKLARANHFGQTEQPWMLELSELGSHLLEENAHLVCRAELMLAVNATNQYKFDSASKLLARWQDLPKSVPGLRLWAQVQSSLGQHAAFRAQYHEALTHFDLALEAFSRLSDEDEGGRESLQTLTYRAIVLIDDMDSDPHDVRTAVEKVTGPIDFAIEELSSRADDVSKYRHHLLIRWLVLCGSEKDQLKYLSFHENWSSGESFPWPLILLYRGLLLRKIDIKDARELAMHGYDLATDETQGPTVQLIGACCRAIALALGEEWSDPSVLLDSLLNELPAADRFIQKLRAYVSDPSGEPEELLRVVLPFNFH